MSSYLSCTITPEGLPLWLFGEKTEVKFAERTCSGSDSYNGACQGLCQAFHSHLSEGNPEVLSTIPLTLLPLGVAQASAASCWLVMKLGYTTSSAQPDSQAQEVGPVEDFQIMSPKSQFLKTRVTLEKKEKIHSFRFMSRLSSFPPK